MQRRRSLRQSRQDRNDFFCDRFRREPTCFEMAMQICREDLIKSRKMASFASCCLTKSFAFGIDPLNTFILRYEAFYNTQEGLISGIVPCGPGSGSLTYACRQLRLNYFEDSVTVDLECSVLFGKGDGHFGIGRAIAFDALTMSLKRPPPRCSTRINSHLLTLPLSCHRA